MDTIKSLIKKERERQNNNLELIASENYCSKNVRKACGSILTYKYAEGYPGHRYYGGCEYIDKIELEAQYAAKNIFGMKYANVQPHSGSQANAAAYRALEMYLKKHSKLKNRKMKILSLDLNGGGHLTHGSSVSFSSNLYHFDFYKLGEDGRINFRLVEEAIEEYKPDVLLAGYSAYPYQIKFGEFARLAKKYNLMFMVDMAHIAGLVASGYHDNPCSYADIVTSTTHKTLRGPRGGFILTSNEELAGYVDSAVFPYYQGGPAEHIIAAKAICFQETASTKFWKYSRKVVNNTRAFSDKMIELGANCTKTENHLTLLNTKDTFDLTGKDAQSRLEQINITTNKNMLPNDTEKPWQTSGLRIGFAALTTRGCNLEMAKQIAKIIFDALSDKDFEANIPNYLLEVKKITKKLHKV